MNLFLFFCNRISKDKKGPFYPNENLFMISKRTFVCVVISAFATARCPNNAFIAVTSGAISSTQKYIIYTLPLNYRHFSLKLLICRASSGMTSSIWAVNESLSICFSADQASPYTPTKDIYRRHIHKNKTNH